MKKVTIKEGSRLAQTLGTNQVYILTTVMDVNRELEELMPELEALARRIEAVKTHREDPLKRAAG